MRRVATLVKYSFKRKWAHPTTAIIFLIMPVLITAILWTIFGPKRETFAPLKLAVVNHDENGFFSQFLSSSLTAPEASRWIKAVVTSQQKAEELLRKNKVSAVLIIPEGFSRSVWEGKETQLELLKNPSQQIYPEIAEQLIITFEEGLNFLLTYFRQELDAIRRMAEKGRLEQTAIFSVTGEKFRKLFEIISDFPVKVVEKRAEKKRLPLVIYFFSGMSYFFLLFFASAAILDLLLERKKQVYRRMIVSKLTPFEFVLYHHLSSLLFLLSLEFILALLGRIFFSLTTRHIFLLILTLTIFALLFVSFFGIIVAFVDEEKKASNLSTLFTFIFAMAGGSILPVSALPSSMQTISRLSPLYYVNQATISLFLEKMADFRANMMVVVPLTLAVLALSLYLNTRTCRKEAA